jgi:hypothetical protein
VTIATVDTSSGGLVVGGFVTGVLEDDGDCTFTATPANGSPALVARTTGLANVDNTSCGSTTIPANQLSSGTYKVVLTYRNHNGMVASAPLAVEVS